MINSGYSSIADVKYGSQQISKVYHGSDLIWQKNTTLEMTWGEDMYFPMNTIVSGYSTNDYKTRCGFRVRTYQYGLFDLNKQFEPPTGTDGNGHAVYERFFYNHSGSSNGVKYNQWTILMFQFDVTVQEVKIYDTSVDSVSAGTVRFSRTATDTYGQRHVTLPMTAGEIKVNTNVVDDIAAGTWQTYKEISNRTYLSDGRKFQYYSSPAPVALTNGDSVYDIHTNAALKDTPVRSLYIKGTEWMTPSVSNILWNCGWGRLHVKFRVKKSDYDAWKAQYSTELSAADVTLKY